MKTHYFKWLICLYFKCLQGSTLCRRRRSDDDEVLVDKLKRMEFVVDMVSDAVLQAPDVTAWLSAAEPIINTAYTIIESCPDTGVIGVM